MIKRFAMLGLLLAMCGCGIHTHPAISVAELKLAERTGEYAVITLVLEAENVESDPMPFGNAKYVFRINGSEAYRGEWHAQATAPIDGVVRFELPVVIDAALVPDGASAEYSVSGSIVYVPPGALGEALFNAKFRKGHARFSERGEFTIAGD